MKMKDCTINNLTFQKPHGQIEKGQEKPSMYQNHVLFKAHVQCAVHNNTNLCCHGIEVIQLHY